jgi:light-regulated signal transduction histidine kinase (bacteriophytochrome)
MPDETYKWIEVSAERYMDINTNEPSLLGVIKDIDQRVKSRKEIEKLNSDLEQMVTLRTKELQNAVSELESFSYSVSHDLRAPLRGMHGYANMITEDHGGNLDPEVVRLVDTIKSNARQMGQLIDDLLEFSRLGKKSIAKTIVNTIPIVDKIIEETKLSNPNVKFEIINLNPILADKALITAVFANIISNAAKYSSKKEKPTITISSELKDHNIIYSIKDNGAGFDMAYYKKLFGVFQRLHSHQEFSGTGVGLAIVDKIIKKHGGEIWAESVLNEGATFFFSLPTTSHSNIQINQQLRI